MKEGIVYELNGFYALKIEAGVYHLYRPSGCAVEKFGIVDYRNKPDYALQVAIEKIKDWSSR